MTRFGPTTVPHDGVDASPLQPPRSNHHREEHEYNSTAIAKSTGPHGLSMATEDNNSSTTGSSGSLIFTGVQMRRVSLVSSQLLDVSNPSGGLTTHSINTTGTTTTAISTTTTTTLRGSSYTAMFDGGGSAMDAAYAHRVWPQPREVSLVFGHDVIQVPLKVEHEYINLVLSHREFDVMAVHIPKYDEMQPAPLVQEITAKLKQQIDKQKQRRAVYGMATTSTTSSSTSTTNNQLGELFPDASASFQARILELEYELSRFKTKLAAAKALQTTLTDENTLLRSTLRDMEQRCVENETLQMQNDVLREQSVAAFAENGRLKRLLAATHDQLQELQRDVRTLRTQVHYDQSERAVMVDDVMHRLLATTRDREHVLQESYLAEKRERQLIAEKYYELSGRIRVFCRLRPPSTHCGRPSSSTPTRAPSQALLRPRPNAVLVDKSGKEFAFDQVFGPESSQTDVYAQLEPLVVSFADGFNACIMAYGQTGSGKTHTMVGGSGAKQGMIPRALQQVFAIVDARTLTYRDVLSVTMLEIYNDQIVDLLASDAVGGKLKNESELTSRRVTLWEHVTDVLAEGNANRNIAATSMNVESSRSHALVFLHLESQHRETLDVRSSTLCLVDLAGSERLSRSQVEGDRLKETQHINKSLSALGDVMHALQHKAKHVPYRNSKLTYMLREMLAGHAKTLMMLQLSPDEDDVEESICSLQFGARVSQIQMGAVKTSVESGEIVRLREENRTLETKLQDTKQQLGQRHDDMASLQLKFEYAVSMAEAATPRQVADVEDAPPSPSARSVRSNGSSSTRSSAASTTASTPTTSRTTTSRSSASISRLASLARPSPRTSAVAKASSSASTGSAPATPTLTPATAARVARRQSLTNLSAPSPTAASTGAVSARERLARAVSDPANRRATLGAIGSSSSSPSLLSRRVPRSRAVDDSAAGSPPSSTSPSTSSRARPSPMRRTHSLATPRGASSASTSTTKAASTSTATTRPSAATPLDKRRSLGGGRALPSPSTGTSAVCSKASLKT